ncbi:MAG: hypothetical protein OHK0022_53470 [Roseiflexaceae bacterium]
MAQIVCFSDTAALAHMVRESLGDPSHVLTLLPASRLDQGLRNQVAVLQPSLILLELNRAFDNAHLLFFLRSDESTRRVPIVLLSTSARLDQCAAVLEVDGYLRMPFDASELVQLLSTLLERAVERAA